VTPGTIAALRTTGALTWYNPSCAWSHADAVIVLSDGGGDNSIVPALRRNTTLLIVGPNVVIFFYSAAQAASVDAWVAPSPWVESTMHLLAPEQLLDFVVWPVGVDTALWAPVAPRAARRALALIYVKTEPPAGVLDAARAALLGAGATSVQELRYGSYDAAKYRAALQGAYVMVVFSASESQGVFLFEAWSADVPTLIYAAGFQHEFLERTWLSDPAPYLSGFTGAKWVTQAQLENLLRRDFAFQPRRWVLQHGSLEAVGALMVADVRARWSQAICRRALDGPALGSAEN
jgi:hypothetical protein